MRRSVACSQGARAISHHSLGQIAFEFTFSLIFSAPRGMKPFPSTEERDTEESRQVGPRQGLPVRKVGTRGVKVLCRSSYLAEEVRASAISLPGAGPEYLVLALFRASLGEEVQGPGCKVGIPGCKAGGCQGARHGMPGHKGN